MTSAMTTEQLFANSGGGAPLYFNRDSRQGESFEGTVVESKPVPARDFETNSVKHWDDGSEMMQLAITLQTTLRDPNIKDDDGKRRYFCPWWGINRKALEDAVRQAGDKFVRDGAYLRITFAGFGEQKDRKLNPPKVFDFAYTAAPSATEKLMSHSGVQYANGGVLTGQPATDVPPSTPPVDIVAQARAVQAEQAAKAAAAAPPAGQPNIPGGVDANAVMEAMANVKKLASAGFDAGTIHAMVPDLSMAQITAILAINV